MERIQKKRKNKSGTMEMANPCKNSKILIIYYERITRDFPPLNLTKDALIP